MELLSEALSSDSFEEDFDSSRLTIYSKSFIPYTSFSCGDYTVCWVEIGFVFVGLLYERRSSWIASIYGIDTVGTSLEACAYSRFNIADRSRSSFYPRASLDDVMGRCCSLPSIKLLI